MSKKIGFGSALSFCNTFGGTYTNIATITKFTPNKTTVSDVEIDAFDGPTNAAGLPMTDSLPGWVTRGEYAVDFYFDKTQYNTLYGNIGAQLFYKVIKSDGSGYVFGGYLKELGEEIPLKEAMTASGIIKINGTNTGAFATTQT